MAGWESIAPHMCSYVRWCMETHKHNQQRLREVSKRVDHNHGMARSKNRTDDGGAQALGVATVSEVAMDTTQAQEPIDPRRI